MVKYNIEGIDVSSVFMSSEFSAGEKNIFIHNTGLSVLDDSELFFVIKGAGKIDLMEIGMKVDILRRNCNNKISLVLPYLPYSRQDRYTTGGASFSLKVFANFINSLNLNRVYTVDAHSDVAGVIDNLVNLDITKCVDIIIDQSYRTNNPINVIVAPDAGATKKIYQTLSTSRFKDRLKVITAIKHRDVATGNITGMSIPVEQFDASDKVLVVDDICDGGRTFTELHKLLPTKDNILFVTHGVFSKPDVFKCYNKVYTTDSIEQHEDNKLVISLTYRRKQS